MNLLAMCQKGEVPQDGDICHVQDDASPVVSPLHCYVIHGCADVVQGLHLGREKVDFI